MASIAYLLPVHDAVNPAELRLALRSIADQHLPADVTLRLYIGIDGEIDEEKRALIDGFQPYRQIQLSNRSGLPVVLNRLIESLEDESFIFRMDADDINHTERTVAQLAYLDANPRIGICGTACVQIDEHGNHVNKRRYPTKPEIMAEFICKAIPMLHPTFCFRRSALDQLRYDEKLFYQQDLALLFDALSKGIELGNLDRPLLYWRTGPNFHGRRTARRAFAECRLYFNGIAKLHGVTWRYAYPLMRLAMRLLPRGLFAKLDRLNLRRSLFEEAVR